MQLVERHIINRNHSLYNECDSLCFSSKNIYNRTLYLIRKEYEESKTYNVLNDSYSFMKNEECFMQLPQKVAQATLRAVHATCNSFFGMIRSKNVDNKNIRFPKFLHKEDGRYVATFNSQTISKKVFDKSHKIKLSKVNIEFYTKINDFKSINCVRIVPKIEQYVIEVIYTIDDVEKIKFNKRIASIDLGINNLATLTYSSGEQPTIINGKPLKSINQFYNKELAKHKSKLEKVNKKKHSHRTRRLTNKRNNKVNNYLHRASKRIINDLKDKNISVLVIGKNDGWKRNCNIGSRSNQNFIQIPHSRFVGMISYKCEKVGIKVILTEESYTSKCSFLDLEDIRKHDDYKGKRIHRGLFVSQKGNKINADVNGSYNIMRKAFPKVFNNGIEGVVVHPVIVKL